MPPKGRPKTPPPKEAEEAKADGYEHLDAFYRHPTSVPLMLVARLKETLQAHASGVSQLAMGATDPPLLLSAASDARVSMWSPSTWRPVNDFGGDDPYVFGGEEAWMGPRMGPVTSMVTSTRTLPASPLKSADADTSGKGAKGGGKAPEAPSADSPGSVVQQVITGSTRGMLQLWQLWSPPQKPPPEPQEGADDGFSALKSWLNESHSHGREPASKAAKPATPPAAKKPATPKSKPATPAAGKLGEQAAAAAAAEPAVWTCVRALEVREPGLPTSAVASIVTHEGKLYVGSRDHRIRCYAMDTWALLATIEQPEAVTTLHVHRMDGYADCLISGCIDHCIRVWSLADLSLQCTLIGHTNAVTSVASFPDGRLVSGGADGAVRMWKVSDRKTSRGTHQWEQQWQLPQCCPCSVRSLAVAGCKQLLVGGADGGVRVWFYEPQPEQSHDWRLRRTLSDHTGAVESMLCVGDSLVTAGADGALRIYR